jgi:hypothetical protein
MFLVRLPNFPLWTVCTRTGCFTLPCLQLQYLACKVFTVWGAKFFSSVPCRNDQKVTCFPVLELCPESAGQIIINQASTVPDDEVIISSRFGLG